MKKFGAFLFSLTFLNFAAADDELFDLDQTTCFRRAYTEDHLKAQPKQAVTYIEAKIVANFETGPRTATHFWSIYLRARGTAAGSVIQLGGFSNSGSCNGSGKKAKCQSEHGSFVDIES